MIATTVSPHESLRCDLREFRAVGLAALNDRASLQTRKDRKYVVSANALRDILAGLPDSTRILEIDGRRWFGYESVYFDTPEFDSYRLAACRRPSRFKVRTRTYVDSGAVYAEVKRKDGRCQTIKERIEVSDATDVGHAVRAFADRFDAVRPHAADLVPVLTSRYQRATLMLPEHGVRFTIDADYECAGSDHQSAGISDLIVETKTSGGPSLVDRALWAAGHRPVKISKFATGLAAMHPELPANRWTPILRSHFGRGTASPTASHSSFPSRLQGGH